MGKWPSFGCVTGHRVVRVCILQQVYSGGGACTPAPPSPPWGGPAPWHASPRTGPQSKRLRSRGPDNPALETRPSQDRRLRATPALCPRPLQAPLPVSGRRCRGDGLWMHGRSPPVLGRSPGALSAAVPVSGTMRQADGAGDRARGRACAPGLRCRGGLMPPKMGSLRAALQLPPAGAGPEGWARPGLAGGICPSVGAVASSLGGHRSAILTPPPPAPTPWSLAAPASGPRGASGNSTLSEGARAACARPEPSMTSWPAAAAGGMTCPAQAQMGI